MGIEGKWLFNLNEIVGDESKLIWSLLCNFDTGKIIDPQSESTRGTYQLEGGCFTAEIPLGQQESAGGKVDLILVLEGDFKEDGFLAFPVTSERPGQGARHWVAYFQRVGILQ